MKTNALHKKFPKQDPYGAVNMPVYHSASYQFASAKDMEDAFQGKTSAHTYSRISNPTVEYFENRIAEITGAMSVTALNSGMAAISNAIITLCKSGCNIITSKHLFGNTYSFFASTMAEFGVEIRFCDLTNIEEVKTKFDNKTAALFLEIVTNPQLEVADIKALSETSHSHNVPLIADTTIIPFGYFKAKELGVDIEVVSTTKYISGGATSLGGVILDYGNFNWENTYKLGRFANEFGLQTFTVKLRKEIHRNLGAYLNPHTAYMQTLGLETMELRYEKACNTCLALADKLTNTKGVESVNYIGLESNPYFELSKKQFNNTFGAMLTFNLKDKESCYRLLDNLKLILRATNLFDNKTLAIHPASTIYGTFTEAAKAAMNISDKTIRLSIGLEDVEDLHNDILGALQ